MVVWDSLIRFAAEDTERTLRQAFLISEGGAHTSLFTFTFTVNVFHKRTGHLKTHQKLRFLYPYISISYK
jgi:hypothetical protein